MGRSAITCTKPSASAFKDQRWWPVVSFLATATTLAVTRRSPTHCSREARALHVAPCVEYLPEEVAEGRDEERRQSDQCIRPQGLAQERQHKVAQEQPQEPAPGLKARGHEAALVP